MVILLIVLNLLLFRSNIQLYGKESYTAKNEALAKKEYDDVVAREKALSSDITRLSSSEGIDLELRRKFQVVKPGEEAVVIVATPATSTKPELEEKPGFWQNIKSFLSL